MAQAAARQRKRERERDSAFMYNCRAGHFRYFSIFLIIKNDFSSFFIKLITFFCTSPI